MFQKNRKHNDYFNFSVCYVLNRNLAKPRNFPETSQTCISFFSFLTWANYNNYSSSSVAWFALQAESRDKDIQTG